jgi:rhomboid-like protein
MPHKQIIARIFGPNVSPLQGYNVLRILHHRRTSGSLVDYGVDNLGPLYGDITHEQAKRGLEWLRGKYPIDEARAAEEWAEKEANRIAYELWLADPDNADSKWNDPARVWAEKQQKEAEEAAKANQEEEYRIGMLRAGPSQFERNIAEKRQQRLEAAAKRAEEKEKKEKEMQELVATGKYLLTPGGTQLMKPGQTAYVDIFGREQVSRRNEEMAKWKERSVNKEYSTPEEMLAKTTLVCICCPLSLTPEVLKSAHTNDTCHTGPTPRPHDHPRNLNLPRLPGLRPLLHAPNPRAPPLA